MCSERLRTRAKVRTGGDPADAMGWVVSEGHGVPTVSHDGSDFGSHANVVLVLDRQWGVVVMENAETPPTSSSAPAE